MTETRSSRRGEELRRKRYLENLREYWRTYYRKLPTWRYNKILHRKTVAENKRKGRAQRIENIERRKNRL